MIAQYQMPKKLLFKELFIKAMAQSGLLSEKICVLSWSIFGLGQTHFFKSDIKCIKNIRIE